MLTAILERSSWIIYKVGMPLVFFYHLLLSSTFFNTAAEDAHGIEKIANYALAPMQYFFEGKRAIPEGDHYRLERKFNYEKSFFIKTAASVTALPFSFVAGSLLKSVSYLSPETRTRAHKIYEAIHNRQIHLNTAYYHSIGLQVDDYRNAPLIDPPKYKRHPNATSKLAADTLALKDIVQILSKHNVPFWLDCGSCLGTYQYGGSIPHDWDIDIGILMTDFENVKNALQELDPKKYVVQDWSGRARPKSYLKVFVHESGGMIDIYNFAIDAEKKTIHTLLSNEFNIFVPPSWVSREQRYCTPMPFEYIFPLKKAIFEGIEVPVPNQTEKYLQVFYGQNLAPAKVYNEITQSYEKDLSHPYWQLSNAH